MTVLTHTPTTRFSVPDQRFAAEPPERRGLARDQVRLLVADGRTGRLEHSRFDRLPDFLEPGDLVVVNNSQTIAAELDGTGEGNWPMVLHVATRLDDGSWVVELRTAPDAAEPILTARPGQLFRFGDTAAGVPVKPRTVRSTRTEIAVVTVAMPSVALRAIS